MEGLQGSGQFGRVSGSLKLSVGTTPVEDDYVIDEMSMVGAAAYEMVYLVVRMGFQLYTVFVSF